jgi:hypothetical protein
MSIIAMQELCARNAAVWAEHMELVVAGTRFSFDDGHDFQEEWLLSEAKRIAIQAGTQTGKTLVFTVLRILHGQIFGHYPKGVLVVFPKQDLADDFSKARYDPIIAANPAIGRYVKAGGQGTDTARLKTVGSSNLYFVGATTNRKVGLAAGDSESANLRNRDVDRVNIEEGDLNDASVVELAEGRLAHSDVHEFVEISNPTLPDRGICDAFLRGDQRFWYRRCDCGRWCCAVKDFMDDPEKTVQRDENGRGFVSCPKCGRNVGPRRGSRTLQLPGEWHADCPSHAEWGVSYQANHLMTVYNDPWTILRKFRDPPNGDPTRVWRQILGLGYVGAEEKLQEKQVLALCGQEPMATHHDGPCAMGIDVGKNCHIVLGCKREQNEYEIFKVVECPMAELKTVGHDLRLAFNVRWTVIDNQPEMLLATEFQKAERGVVLGDYKVNNADPDFDSTPGWVKMDRTVLLDWSYAMVEQKMLVLPRRTPIIETFAKQVCDPAKVKEETKTGSRYVYISSSKGDHFRHALGYFKLAADHGSLCRRGFNQDVASTETDHDYDVLEI